MKIKRVGQPAGNENCGSRTSEVNKFCLLFFAKLLV